MARLSRRKVVGTGLSLATLGAIGYRLWPRMEGYHEEVERQRQLLSAKPELGELVRMATLAANGHTTQPWKFRLEDQQISILPDLTRRTKVVDPDDHHLYVSLGCAAENLVIAPAATGRAADVEIKAGKELQIDVAFSNSEPTPGALYDAIPLRQSTRWAYDGQPISAEDMRRLEAAARER